MASEWTPELKEEVVSAYLAKGPTSENTTDILLELAEQFDKTPNGVRRILIADGSYVSKGVTNTTSAPKKEGTRKSSKSDSIAELIELLNFNGISTDLTIIDKLTGKAAVYFTDVVKEALRQSK